MEYPTANIEQRLGKFFLIRCKSKRDLVLEIKDSQDKPGSPLVVGEVTNEDEAGDHQLWFIDRTTSTIRCKLNSFCIDYNDKRLVAQPFMGSHSPRWDVRENDTISEWGSDNVITISAGILIHGSPCHVTQYKRFPGQSWSLSYLPAKYFVVRHQESKKVLDIRGDSAKEGAQVITYAAKNPIGENQLWYEDQNGMIHSKLNDYVLYATDKDVKMHPYDSNDMKQSWVIYGSLIQDRCQPSRVLDVQFLPFSAYDEVIATCRNIDKSKLWSFEDVPTPPPNSFDHCGTGKYFVIHQPYFGLNVTVDVKAPLPIPTSLTRLSLHANGLFSDGQLFYFDRLENVIRSKADDRLCFEVRGADLMLGTYQTNNQAQQLEYKMGKLYHREQILTLGVKNQLYDTAPMECYFTNDPFTHHQEWTLKHATAQHFFVKNNAGGRVLEVQPNRNVGLGYRKPQTRSAHQLWYEDESGELRSKLNGFALRYSQGTLQVDWYNSGNPQQGWVVSNDRIRNRHSGLLLDAQSFTRLGPSESKDSDSQRWTFPND